MSISLTSSEPRLNYVTCANAYGFHRTAYWEWGDPDNPRLLLCVHGLTRTGRDFDEVARAMSKTHRVICPDVAGRGASDRLPHPSLYAIPQYVADMLTLIAHIKPSHLDWLGTSMGGLIGMVLAGRLAQLQGSLGLNNLLPAETSIPLAKMILNDVGPRLEAVALTRISSYVGIPVRFTSLEEAVSVLKVRAASFGPMSDAHWEMFARAGLKQEEDGSWVQNYDLGIAEGFKELEKPEVVEQSETYVWACYKALATMQIPTLIIHGETSDLLSAQTVDEMLAYHTGASFARVPGTGHAPTLLAQEQVKLVEDFLK